MIQYYDQLHSQVQLINEKIFLNNNFDNRNEGQSGERPSVFIQKSYSTARFICLSLRTKGKTHFLYIGRGSSYEGLWLGEKFPSSNIRIKDSYLEYFRKYLQGAQLISLKLDEADRIIYFCYYKNGQINNFSLFFKGRDLYFVHVFKNIEKAKSYKLVSWVGLQALPEDIVDEINDKDSIQEQCADLEQMIRNDFLSLGAFERFNASNSESNKSKEMLSISSLLLAEEKTLSKNKNTKRHKNFIKRKQKNILSDLDKCQKWKRIEDELGEADLDGLEEIVLAGVRIKLSRNNNYFQNRDLVYKKIKGFKKGEKILKNRLVEIERLVTKPIVDNSKKYQEVAKILFPVWKKDLKSKKTIRDSEVNLTQFTLSLGDNSKKAVVAHDVNSNDYIRNIWASKSDLWFHLDGYKSAHLIVKVDNIGLLSLEEIEILASVLSHFSKPELNPIPIMYTQVKNLRGQKGKAGSVTYKKEKYLTVSQNIKFREVLSL